MKTMVSFLPAILVFLVLGLGHSAWAESDQPPYDQYEISDEGGYEISDEAGDDLLTPEELDDLMAPIALYPDPLIAQILPAATFVDQIDEAARYVRQYGKSARIDDQPWDVSVKAVAHYPDVLFMMDQKYEWTVSLGQAFLEQQQDVMDAIQRLRAEAQARGNLLSTREQQVIHETEAIRIVPATPEYIYVPVYDPRVVYVESYNPAFPLITFGIGFTIGAWLNRDCNWRERRVYYHGWRQSGWVSRARPHIHDRRGIYINRRATAIDVNNRVMLHDTRRYRQQLRNDVWRQREQRGLSTPPPRINRPRPGRWDQPRPGRIEQPRPGRIEQPRPGRIDRQGPGRIDRPRPGRSEQPGLPGGGRQRSPGAALPAPLTVPTASSPTLQQPAPVTVRPQPAPAAVRQPAPATIRPAPATVRQPSPATVRPAPATVRQPAPAAVQQPPPATVHQPAPAAVQQPAPAAIQQPPAAAVQQPPAAAVQQPPAAAVQQPPPAAGRQRQPSGSGRAEGQPRPGDVFRGRDVRKEQPASRSGYGGYGSNRDATIYHQRGQSSRENMRQINRPASPGPPSAIPAPIVAPALRPAVAPAPRPAVVPAQRPAVIPAQRPAVVPAQRPAVIPAQRPAHQTMQPPPSVVPPSAPRTVDRPSERPAVPERMQQRR